MYARRIHQRRRQIVFGKNTAGYEEYTKQFPKEKRRRNSMAGIAQRVAEGVAQV
jgi:hypothetical protein